jgi:nitrite reductase/ring-hydroxylating ferredoxin subunit
MDDAGAVARAGEAASPEEWLCASATLADGGKAHVFDLLEYGRAARAFVLRFDGAVVAYLNRCAHVPAEMDWQEGEFLDADRRFIVCSIHGATYEPLSGHCVAGPCVRGRLTCVPVRERDGQVYWYPSPNLQPVLFDEPAATVQPWSPE